MLAPSLSIRRRERHKALSSSLLVAALSATLIAAFACFGGAGSAWADVASSEPDVAQLSVTAPVKADAVLDPATGAVSVPASTIKNNGQYPIALSSIGMDFAEGAGGVWTATPEGHAGVELTSSKTSASVGATLEAGSELNVSWDTTFSGFAAGKMANKRLGSWTWTFASAAKRIDFDANGGTFASGGTANSVVYRYGRKTSHSANLDDEGNATGNHASNLAANDVVTIPGAELLSIDVWCSTETPLFAWLAIYPAGVEPSASNYADATISGGKLGGGRATTKADATHETFIVEGDTAQFFFKGDRFYGYYAVIMGTTIETLSGSYSEPKNADENWEFTGWNTAADGTGTAYTAVNAWTAPSGCTLYAQYKDPRQIFAVYSADDNSLDFYNRKELPAAGDAFEGKTATAVWDGLENTSYSYSSQVPWYNRYRSSITSVAFVDDSCKPTSLDYWFYGLSAMTSFDGSKLDTSSVTSLTDTFSGCSKLTNLDSISNWDTSKVTSLWGTFSGCSKLTNLDSISNWDTSKVTSLGSTFYDCSNLTNLDLSNWNPARILDLSGAFCGCGNLTNLDWVSNWDTSSVTSLAETFRGCGKLTNLDSVSNWDTSKVTSLEGTFYDCGSLTNLDLSRWDTSKVTSLAYTFMYCFNLTNLDISNWDTSNVSKMSSTFYYCSKLTNLDLSNWRTAKIWTLEGTFYYCSKLTNLDLSGFDTSSISDMWNTFYGCSRLTIVSIGDNWKWLSSNRLPTPKSTYITGADGKWYSASDGARYAPSEIPSNKADTYYASSLLSPWLAGDASVSITGEASGTQLTCAFSTPQSGVSPSYSWSRNGVQIDGATSAAYSLTAADCGHALTCTVTDSSGTKDGSRSASYDVPAAKSLSLSGNGGTFASTGAETSAATVLSRNDLIEKRSHTANIDDAGNATGTYASNLAANDVVTIPGAETLTIDVWCSTESTGYDWLAIYPAGIEPSASNYANATISGGKLGGGQATTKARATHKTFTVEGDTAQFFFRSDSSGNYYGYYAVVSKGERYLYCIDGTIEEPVREGFTFAGWNTAADGSGRDVEIIDAADREQLFAKWVANDGGAEPGNDETRLAGAAGGGAPGARSAENEPSTDITEGVDVLADDSGAGLGTYEQEANGAGTATGATVGNGLGAIAQESDSDLGSDENELVALTADDARALASSATAALLVAAGRRERG